MIDEFNPKIYRNSSADQIGNIGFVTKARRERTFKGFLVDNRLNDQTVVLNWLKTNACGFRNAKSKSAILESVSNIGINISGGKLSNFILFPLKRTGLIGSSSTGFFYIDSHEDLQRAYAFHESKYFGIRYTMDVYEQRARNENYSIRRSVNLFGDV